MRPVQNPIRKEAIAGSFYPGEERKIVDFISFIESTQTKTINRLLDETKNSVINGLIVPHAGWIYSGKTALLAYKLLEKINPDKIAVLGPSHRFPINRILSDGHHHWETPLGPIKIVKDNFFESNITYHAHEHSIEVQAPFIKYYSANTHMLPLVVGDITDFQAEQCARHLFDHNYFLIISTDLSHFKTIETAKKVDSDTINKIQSLSNGNLEACGADPLKIAYKFSELCKTKPILIDYSTSADVTGDLNSVVGYASFWF